MAARTGTTTGGATASPDFDVVVVGAGFAGLVPAPSAARARVLGDGLESGATTSAAPGTGTATRAPAATSRRIDYSYSFDPELEHEWTWSEKYADPAGDPALRCSTSPTSYDLRRDIRSRHAGRGGDVGRRRRRPWTITHRPAATTITLPLLRDGHRLPVDAEGRRHRRHRPLRRARSTSPAAGPTRASTSPASGSA